AAWHTRCKRGDVPKRPCLLARRDASHPRERKGPTGRPTPSALAFQEGLMSLDITTAFLLILALIALYEIGMLARPKPATAKASEPPPQPLAPPSPPSRVAP